MRRGYTTVRRGYTTVRRGYTTARAEVALDVVAALGLGERKRRLGHHELARVGEARHRLAHRLEPVPRVRSPPLVVVRVRVHREELPPLCGCGGGETLSGCATTTQGHSGAGARRGGRACLRRRRTTLLSPAVSSARHWRTSSSRPSASVAPISDSARTIAGASQRLAQPPSARITASTTAAAELGSIVRSTVPELPLQRWRRVACGRRHPHAI